MVVVVVVVVVMEADAELQVVAFPTQHLNLHCVK